VSSSQVSYSDLTTLLKDSQLIGQVGYYR